MTGQSARPVRGADDADLVERAQAGDANAFGQLYQRHVDRVYSFIAFRVRDGEVAQDLTQEVFIQALRGLEAFDWRGSLSPWLLRIARNSVVDHWRRTARRRDRPLSAVEFGEDEAERGDAERLSRLARETQEQEEAVASGALDMERVAVAARGLTELQQQVIALRFSAGLSVRETASAMGRSEGAVKNLQHHALKALRRRLVDGAGT